MDHPAKGGDAPPAYSEREAAEVDAPHEHVAIEGSASVDEVGRINVDLERVDDALLSVVSDAQDLSEVSTVETAHSAPPLNIVIMIVGSRGDVQPFLPIGLTLKAKGHRVRIATHPTFKDFVEAEGLEFFSIGGDPAALMAFMVKNPGLLPGMEAVRKGDISQRRREIDDMIHRCWRACIDSGNGLEEDKPDPDVPLTPYQIAMQRPFIANAIIANPPSFAHVHCAERLSIPLHMVFTMPWSPTKYFSHPLANMRPSTVDKRTANYLSYLMVETITWQGLGDLINDFREHVLGLNTMNPAWGPGVLDRLKIPFTYCFSPALIPKPPDWRSHISITGFNFLPAPQDYAPPEDLAKFLANGSPPIYIGFGSIVVDDPNALTSLIFSAVEAAGVRALVSKGWGGLGADIEVPENVFLLGNCPHAWLFEHVSAVVHHGGAGTSAVGIACGKPTVIVPFFGDQPFWAAMIAKAGAGPGPLPFKELTSESLTEAIAFALRPETNEAAKELASKIKAENGPEEAARVFNNNLPYESMKCDLGTGRVAVWRIKRKKKLLKLSALAMAILVRENALTFEDVKLVRTHTYQQDPGALEPISGSITASMGALSDLTIGLGKVSMGLSKMPSKQNTLALDPTALTTPGSEPSSPSLERKVSSATTTKERNPSNLKKGLVRLAVGTKASIVDIPMAFAQGMHNAPRLYGDTTVRDNYKITGFGSGMEAAGKELVFGVYDGIAGLVTQPIEGAKNEGTIGFAKGFGKGIGGAFFKPFAAMSGVFAYPFKGIHKEIQRLGSRTDDKRIRRALITQGEEDLEGVGWDLREEVLKLWKEWNGGDT